MLFKQDESCVKMLRFIFHFGCNKLCKESRQYNKIHAKGKTQNRRERILRKDILKSEKSLEETRDAT